MDQDFEFIGIDYGSKMAGTTAVAYLENGKLQLVQSEKKQDADQFLSEIISRLSPKSVFIDAPLSLPSAFYGKGDDYFYRKADRECKAMSPMFLGGLTARAIKLKAQHADRNFYEVYPGMLARDVLDLGEAYAKKDKFSTSHQNALLKHLEFELAEDLSNWHQFDAVLAWLSGLRYKQEISISYGDPTEGLIIV